MTHSTSRRATQILLVLIVFSSFMLPMQGRHPGIRFIDEMFFLTGAWSLVEHGAISVTTESIFEEGRAGQFCVPGRNDRLYSQNPIGFSFLLALIYKLGGWKRLLNTNLLLFPVVVLMVYALFRKWFDRPVSLAGTFLFAISPTFVLFSTFVMTHSFALLIQIAGMLMILNPERLPSKQRYFLSGLLMGINLLVRLDNILMIIPLTLITLFPLSQPLHSLRNQWLRRFLTLFVALSGFAVGSSVHFIYQKMVFGHALQSGYSDHLETTTVLDVSRLPESVPRGLKRIQFTGMPVTATLGLIGFLFLMIRKPYAAIHLGGWGIAFLVFYLTFFAGTKHDFNLRYYIPLFPMLAGSAAWLILSFRRIRAGILLIPLLLLITTTINVRTGHTMISSRNRFIQKQSKLIDTVTQSLPPNVTVFLPYKEALLMELMRSDYDIRNTDYLWKTIPSSDEEIQEHPGSHPSNPHKLTRLQKDLMPESVPSLLPRLLREGRTVYIVSCKNEIDTLTRLYRVSLSLITETPVPGSGDKCGIYRIDGVSSF